MRHTMTFRFTRSHHHLARRRGASALSALLLTAVAGCGGGGGSDAVQARPQSISIEATPASVGTGQTSLKASASSGLAVNIANLTPDICTADAGTGLLTTKAGGRCAVRLTQSGDERYAPAAPVMIELTVIADQTLRFRPEPANAMTLGDLATLRAEATSALPTQYSSLTPSVCSIDPGTGVITGHQPGNCMVAANQPGNAYHRPALQLTHNLAVNLPDGVSLPGAPQGVTVRNAGNAQTLIVNASAVDSGGAPLLAYTVRSVPAGVEATGSSLPLTVHCPASCAGLAFTLSATNTWGEGNASSSTDIVTRYQVKTTFYEPDTQPRDSIFTGSFTLNATTGEVTDLRGHLSESMTGSASGAAPLYDMVLLPLTHQLSSVTHNTLGGRLVTTFLQAHTRTFWTGTGGDGWTPEAGILVGGVHHGFPVAASNPGNAYVRIFVNTSDPLAPLTQAQINQLAYADCAPGGMMGAVCMTGTSAAGHGKVGTMSGYPVAQTITLAD